MSEEFGPDFITVTDEDGNDIELELLDVLEHKGQTYMAFFPAVPEDETDEDSEDYGMVILKSIHENGEELLSTLDSEEELTEVYDLFMELLFQDEEEGPLLLRRQIRNEIKVPCGVRDESFINPHFVIRDAGSSSGLQASRLPLLRLEVGSSKGRCRQPTCYSCAGYNRTHTAAAGHFTFGKKRRSRFFPK